MKSLRLITALVVCIFLCGCFTMFTKTIIERNDGVLNLNRNINDSDKAIVPTDALQSAIGGAGASGIPSSYGLIKNASGDIKKSIVK